MSRLKINIKATHKAKIFLLHKGIEINEGKMRLWLRTNEMSYKSEDKKCILLHGEIIKHLEFRDEK